MSVTVTIPVDDVDDQLLAFTSIQLERSLLPDSAFSLVTTITLVAHQTVYAYEDGAGASDSWYRYRLYNAVGPVASSYSNPWQPWNIDRKAIRQEMIEHYQMGMVLVASEGGDASHLVTNDVRMKSGLYRTDRAKGGWIKVISGGPAGQYARVTSSTGSTGTHVIDPPLTLPLAEGDVYEWHWGTDPMTCDRAINDALKRYYYLDEVMITGAGLTVNEYDLHALFPWLQRKEDVFGVWWYPLATAPLTRTGRQEPWVGQGRWSGVREDNGRLTLRLVPGIDTNTTLYLEVARPMPSLANDNSLAVPKCQLDLAAALTYDEVLAALTRPGAAANKDADAWKADRTLHQLGDLKRMLEREQLNPRPFPAQTIEPYNVRQPWSAR